jgi:Xaa-Pro aminopeptidase
MRNYSNRGGLGTADWLWASVKDNPDGLLLLAAGCALLLRRGRSIERTERDNRRDAQEYLGDRETLADDIPHQSRVDAWANEASGIAENAREQAVSMGKKMSETAADYAASVSEYARGTQEQVVEQSRRLAEKAQNRVQSLMQHQPLAVALVGLAAGAAVAAGARPASSSGNKSGLDQLTSDSQHEGEESSEEAKAAKAVLDAQQKAVDDIRAGHPAPYYFTARQSSVPSGDAAPSEANDPHAEKK